MTIISGLGSLRATSAARRASGAGATFSVPLEPGSRAEHAEAAGAVGIVGMLALQEDAGAAVQDREARRHGQSILAELAKLQRDVLGGRVDRNRLSRLAALADDMPRAEDGRLRAVLAAVSVRARVELARWDAGRSRQAE